MKIRNPRSRFDLKIKRTDRVLDVGGGHAPHPRANVVVDKYSEDNTHRCGDLKVRKNQIFIEADGESLPFKDKEFDYVICNHVLEHVPNPHKFLSELSRVGKRGYIETPALIGEFLHPKESHVWLILEFNNKLVLYDKDTAHFRPSCDFGELFLTYLQSNSLGYKIFDKTYPLIREVHYEWEGEVTCEVNPDDPEIKKFFTQPWDAEMIRKFYPERKVSQEIVNSGRALLSIVKTYFS